MDSIRHRAAAAAFVISLAASLLVISPVLDPVRGLSIDILTALRWRAFGNAHAPDSSPVVVVALDEETFRTPPFEGTPAVTWTPQIAQVLNALIDGGAKIVGFDIIFPTSIEQSAVPFAGETLGARVRGFDRDYLRALALGARADKVVLGQVQHQDRPVVPSPGQRAAVGHGQNIRVLNAFSDSDDVVRRIPLSFTVDGALTPSMAVELAARATGTPAGQMRAGSSAVANTIALNFAGGSGDIPTYSFADLTACAEKNDTAFYRRHFKDKVVLIGTLLDVEDRKITSKRFATAADAASAPRCGTPAPSAGQKFARDSISGVYIHATAVNNLIRGEALVETSRVVVGVAAFVLAVLSSAAALSFGPAVAALGCLAAAFAWIAAATFAFRNAVALPLIEPIVASVITLAVTIGYRFVVADRSKRLLRQSFALYLAPAVIEKMISANKLPVLGGETRTVTVYFSDIADFSSLSENVSPANLVAAMNEYLTAMTEIIQQHGGFIDKYMGDAIVAVFGAPLDDANHAGNAVKAALQCRARLGELDRVQAIFGHAVRQRIGINTGEALVGNIGSTQRFNYTVMGDTVNLAARLEGANKFYGTTIVASEMTMSATGPLFAWRELDLIRVKGRAQTVRIFEPLSYASNVSPEQMSCAKTYAGALAAYRDRDFAAATEKFSRFAETDPPSAYFTNRAAALVQTPTGSDWEPVNTLDEK